MRQVFQQIPWIYPQDPQEIIELCHKHGTMRHVKKGGVLKSGGESQKLFHLVEGICAYFINYAEGKPRSFALILPGSSLGDLTCITGQKVNVTTSVLRDAKILTLSPEIYLSAIKSDAELAIKLCRHAINKQESSLEATITNFTHEPAMRLKIFLQALIIRYQNKIEEWNKVPLILTHEELGMMINTTRVTVNRIFSQWEKEGLIKKDGKQIHCGKVLFGDIYDWTEHF